jgi:hypothetical protein
VIVKEGLNSKLFHACVPLIFRIYSYLGKKKADEAPAAILQHLGLVLAGG